MRVFFLFVALLAGSLVLAAVVTYPAWLLVSEVSIQPVHRVMHRAAMLFALIGLIYLTRRLGLADRESLGYGVARAAFLRQMAVGWFCGVLLMIPLTTLLLALDIRELKPGFSADLPMVVLGGLVSGFVVAFIEETFFRGVLFTAVQRYSGVFAAAIAPSLLYAALHFLGGKLRVPAEEVSWIHGFEVLGKLFERYAQPFEFADSFAALFVLGSLLALVRARTGNIAACVGLHAAGVTFIAVLRDATRLDPTAAFAGLAGNYDGVIGWAALLWFALIALAFLAFARRASASAS